MSPAPYFSSLVLGSSASSLPCSLLAEWFVRHTLPCLPHLQDGAHTSWSGCYSSGPRWPGQLCVSLHPSQVLHHGRSPGCATCKFLLLSWILSSSSPLNPWHLFVWFNSHLLRVAFLDPPSKAEFSLPSTPGLSWYLLTLSTGSNGCHLEWFVYFCVFPLQMLAPPCKKSYS